MSTTPVRIHVDGAARGNPGPAAYAYVIDGDGRRIEDAGKLGRATNNVAEYTALVKALERAAELGAKRLDIRSDSELMVRQMNGVYKVKSPELKELYEEACDLRKHFDSVSIQHVARADNGRADELCNLALDGLWRGPAEHASRPKPAPDQDADPAWQEALATLAAAAGDWAESGAADDPPPEKVLLKLRKILSK